MQTLLPYTAVKMGGGIDPTTKVTHSGLNLPLVFSGDVAWPIHRCVTIHC